MNSLAVTLGPLKLANPVLVSSGTFGYGWEFEKHLPLDRLGGLITKTVTLRPREGNPPPRLIETPSGMLNSVGLQNVGLEAFMRDKLPKLAGLPIPIIVSIMGETVEDVEEMCRRLEHEDRAAAIELNLSCPNVKHRDKLLIAQDPEATRAFVAAARGATRKPLIAKLTPDVNVVPIAEAAEAAGADILSMGNTFTGMSIDPRTRRSRLGMPTGGLSGPAIRPLAVYRVWRARQAVKLPIIGIGGVRSAEDALEFLIAGASAVAVGTANFADPRAALKIIDGLARYASQHQLRSIADLTGTFQAHE